MHTPNALRRHLREQDRRDVDARSDIAVAADVRDGRGDIHQGTLRCGCSDDDLAPAERRDVGVRGSRTAAR
jgi:hypothetical protein